VVAESLRSGDRTTVALATLTTLLFACERERRRREPR
jgi:hypothetical protein